MARKRFTFWQLHRTSLLLVACAASFPAVPSEAALDDAPAGASAHALTGDLTLSVGGLRSSKGMIRACLTRNPAFFPDCERDPLARKANASALGTGHLEFANLPLGDYALMVLHDENGNAKLDAMLGIPREGVGFSRNPVLRFGPPKWDAVRIQVPGGFSTTSVKIKYFF